MQLLYPAFSHIPASQQAGSDLQSGSLLLCSIPGLVSISRWPQLKGSWERCMCCPAEWGTHPRIHFSSLRLRVQKPSYRFPWIVLHPLGYHVQGKHLSCVPERVSILVLALREKSRCWAEEPWFQRGVCIQT